MVLGLPLGDDFDVSAHRIGRVDKKRRSDIAAVLQATLLQSVVDPVIVQIKNILPRDQDRASRSQSPAQLPPDKAASRLRFQLVDSSGSSGVSS